MLVYVREMLGERKIVKKKWQIMIDNRLDVHWSMELIGNEMEQWSREVLV